MAYSPGAGGATRTASRAESRSRSNGRPASRPPAPAVRRPSVSFLAGLGIGLAVGAAAALLLAPRSGAETRRALRVRGRKIGNRARDAWDDLAVELEATRRALKRRNAKVEIEEERAEA
jgi:hypothetical protein